MQRAKTSICKARSIPFQTGAHTPYSELPGKANIQKLNISFATLFMPNPRAGIEPRVLHTSDKRSTTEPFSQDLWPCLLTHYMLCIILLVLQHFIRGTFGEEKLDGCRIMWANLLASSLLIILIGTWSEISNDLLELWIKSVPRNLTLLRVSSLLRLRVCPSHTLPFCLPI